MYVFELRHRNSRKSPLATELQLSQVGFGVAMVSQVGQISDLQLPQHSFLKKKTKIITILSKSSCGCRNSNFSKKRGRKGTKQA